MCPLMKRRRMCDSSSSWPVPTLTYLYSVSVAPNTCCCLHSVAPSSLENAWDVNAFLQYDQSLHRVSSAPPTMHWHAAVEAAAVKAVKAAVLRLLLAAAPTVAMLSHHHQHRRALAARAKHAMQGRDTAWSGHARPGCLAGPAPAAQEPQMPTPPVLPRLLSDCRAGTAV